MFAVIKFLNENTVDYVPTKWIRNGNKVLWPLKWSTTIGKLRSANGPPQAHWPIHDIAILGVYGK